MALQAAGNVAIDPDAAKMATEEPDLSGLIFGLVSLGMATLSAKGAIRDLVQEYRATKAASADVQAFMKSISAKVPDPKIREKLIDEATNAFVNALVELVDDEAAWNFLVDSLPEGESQLEKVELESAGLGGPHCQSHSPAPELGQGVRSARRAATVGRHARRHPEDVVCRPRGYESDHGLDRIGVVVHPDGRMEVYHLEMKWKNPPSQGQRPPGVQLTQGGEFGTQGGGRGRRTLRAALRQPAPVGRRNPRAPQGHPLDGSAQAALRRDHRGRQGRHPRFTPDPPQTVSSTTREPPGRSGHPSVEQPSSVSPGARARTV